MYGAIVVRSWSSWKYFPAAESGDPLEAPIGPGVYEVRHISTGHVVAFGPAANVAQALSKLKLNDGLGSGFPHLFGKQPQVSRVADLEHRTCATASGAEAKLAAHHLLRLRRNGWRWRLNAGRSSGWSS